MSTATIPHPLDNLSADEIRRVTAIVCKERGQDDSFIFNSMTLREPSKYLMMAFLGWDRTSPKPATIEREAFVVLQDRPR